MKKLTAGLVMLVMFGMCAASFGDYLLVYNVSTTVNGADDVTDVKATIPLKGYLILNIDDSCDLNPLLNDANLILFGRDANSPKQKVYIQLNENGSSQYLDLGLWRTGDYLFVQMDGEGPFNFEGLSMGKVKGTKIGFSEPNNVAGGLKGSLIVRGGVLLGAGSDNEQDITGTSNISMTLWGKATKVANDPLEPWTQDELVRTGKDTADGHIEGLIELLEGKGFSAVVLPD